jgi:hypothetical protein
VSASREGPAYEWPDIDYDEIKELEAWLGEEHKDERA